MSKNQYRSPQLEKKKKNLFKIKIALWTIAGVILLYGIIFWFNHPSIAIKQVSVSPTVFAPHDDIVALAEMTLEGSYLGLFSKRNLLFVPTGSLRHTIASLHPAIEEVFVHRTSARDIRIDVKEYEAVAKWCGKDARARIDFCYLMNTQGQFFAQETAINTFGVPVFFGDIPEQMIIGSYYTTIEAFENILEFAQGLSQFKIVLDTIETEDFETFILNTVQGPDVMIEKNNNPQEVLDNLRIVIEQEEINKEQLKNLIYIDLRFGNKVFYKIGVPAV